ncbi:MAG TPA: hypothetical protein VF258_00965 [Luteolibacter sp.]
MSVDANESSEASAPAPQTVIGRRYNSSSIRSAASEKLGNVRLGDFMVYRPISEHMDRMAHGCLPGGLSPSSYLGYRWQSDHLDESWHRRFVGRSEYDSHKRSEGYLIVYRASPRMVTISIKWNTISIIWAELSVTAVK